MKIKQSHGIHYTHPVKFVCRDHKLTSCINYFHSPTSDPLARFFFLRGRPLSLRLALLASSFCVESRTWTNQLYFDSFATYCTFRVIVNSRTIFISFFSPSFTKEMWPSCYVLLLLSVTMNCVERFCFVCVIFWIIK